jgi:endo-1,4-beta-xylanase
MKHLYKLAFGLSISVLMASCAKHELLDFHVDKPVSFENQEIIDAYQDLKTYINQTNNPGFKLGAALGISDYINKGVMYRLVNRNFDEIVLGYEMKHGAVVQADGSLNLENVKKLLEEASKAGIGVYGHTLTWHANQNAEYLNGLIQPTIIPGESTPTWDVVTQADFETNDESNYQYTATGVTSFTANGEGADGTGRALKIENESVRTNDWDVQFFVKFAPLVKVGEQYELSMDVRSDAPATYPTQAHIAPTQYKHWDFFGQISSTTEWQTFTKTITIDANTADVGAIAFNLGHTATNFYFDNITLKKYNAKGSGGGSRGHAFTFTNPSAVNPWEAQVAYDLAPLDNDKEYIVKFVAKANKAGTITSELQSTSNYSSDGFGAINLTTEWQEFQFTKKTTAADRNRFLFSIGAFAGTVYIDNITLTTATNITSIIPDGDFENGSTGWGGWGNSSSSGLTADGAGYGGVGDQIIHKTPQEKELIIEDALEHFISGMVDTCKTHVKAWDVVNEPMDDGRPYELKTGIGRTNIAEDEFFWQDYLGKDYAVTAFKLARQHGNQNDILFINDYNLEYSLDKCKGLIEYVEYIESKGAVVDGIGTQMHISTTSDKEKIAEMFRLLAATGKKIKVSELDLGVGVQTPLATEAHYQAQADMYKYVIDKYFELIPASQRYGITIWSPLDSPAGSSWRAGEPIGLWTGGYTRKPAYMGVAEALKGK